MGRGQNCLSKDAFYDVVGERRGTKGQARTMPTPFSNDMKVARRMMRLVRWMNNALDDGPWDYRIPALKGVYGGSREECLENCLSDVQSLAAQNVITFHNDMIGWNDIHAWNEGCLEEYEKWEAEGAPRPISVEEAIETAK